MVDETVEINQTSQPPVEKIEIKPMESMERVGRGGGKKVDPKIVLGVLLLVFLGIGSGLGLSKIMGGSGVGLGGQSGGTQSIAKGEKAVVGQTYGQMDDSFKDKAEGVIEVNESGGEGTHKLLREGGESKTAYLTSSVLDLDIFVGHKVEVLGETFAAQKVGWLMDVGVVKVLE